MRNGIFHYYFSDTAYMKEMMRYKSKTTKDEIMEITSTEN